MYTMLLGSEQPTRTQTLTKRKVVGLTSNVSDAIISNQCIVQTQLS